MKKRYFIDKIVYYSIFVCIFCYIALGNAFTFNIGSRMPVKLGEIFSVFEYFIFVIWFIKKKIDRSKAFEDIKYFTLLWIWILIGIISALLGFVFIGYSMNQFIYGLMYPLRIIHVMCLVIIIYQFIRYYKIDKEKIINYILALYVLVCLIGFFQLVFYPIAADWYNVFYKLHCYWATPDPHKNRLLSTYFDPNYLASILIIPVALLVSKLIYEEKNIKKTIIYLTLIGLFLITILLTKSRSGIVGLVGVIGTLILYYGVKRSIPAKVWIALLIGSIVIVYVFFFSGIEVFERILTFSDDASAQHRFDSWADTLNIFIKYPVMGIGYNMFGAFQETISTLEYTSASAYGVDSSLLMLLMTTGIVGSIPVFIHLFKVLKPRKRGYLDHAVKQIIIASILMSFFNNLLFNLLWIFPIVILALLNKQSNEERDV